MISVVIPAFNEAPNIGTTLKMIERQLRGETKGEIEIIVVDDHSRDGTFEAVGASGVACARAIRLSRQSGSHVAIRCGLMESRGDAVIFMSADGQDDPQSITSLLNKWRSGAKVVWALRKVRDREPLMQKLLAKMFYWILRTFTKGVDGGIDFERADFCLLDRRVVETLNDCGEANTSLFGLIAWVGFSQDFIEYDRKDRIGGKSKWSVRGKIRLALDWIVAFSGTPLKIAGLLGLAVSAVGFLYAAWVVYLAMRVDPVVPGWSSLIVVVLLLGGVQLITLSVIGEYLLRNLSEARRRPLYVIERRSTEENRESHVSRQHSTWV